MKAVAGQPDHFSVTVSPTGCVVTSRSLHRRCNSSSWLLGGAREGEGTVLRVGEGVEDGEPGLGLEDPVRVGGVVEVQTLYIL